MRTLFFSSLAFFLFIILFEVKGDYQASFKNTLPAENWEKKLNELKEYCGKNQYNTHFGILIDFSIPSSDYRYFFVNMDNKTIVKKGLVAHGDCNDFPASVTEAKFSNRDNSHCSSKGKYKVGESYKSKIWGKSYRLHGLEASNSNAFARGIVMHAHSELPYVPNGTYINTSYGCPMLNKQFFNEMAQIIDTTTTPMIMWIYQ